MIALPSIVKLRTENIRHLPKLHLKCYWSVTSKMLENQSWSNYVQEKEISLLRNDLSKGEESSNIFNKIITVLGEVVQCKGRVKNKMKLDFFGTSSYSLILCSKGHLLWMHMWMHYFPGIVSISEGELLISQNSTVLKIKNPTIVKS